MNTVVSNPLEAILESARWAPSGDNTQPWRFETLDERRAVVHGHDTRSHCVYDLDGWATQLSMGALLETAAIAASAHQWRMDCTRRAQTAEDRPTFDLHFTPQPGLATDPLLQAIPQRSVQRRRYAQTPLSAVQKAQLEQAVGPHHAVRWLEAPADRRRMAALLFRSARLRLVTPEAYAVHSTVIEWGARYSVDKVPDQSLGVPQAMLNLMKVAMHSWGRVQFFNTFLAGTLLPRVLMDYWPAVACGAHFLVQANNPAQHPSHQPTDGTDAAVAGGRAMQRFWLTATQLGLSLQPEMTPLIFARYARGGVHFSSTAGTAGTAQDIGQRLESLMGREAVSHGVFLGRIGLGPAVQSRSLRQELAALRGSLAP